MLVRYTSFLTTIYASTVAATLDTRVRASPPPLPKETPYDLSLITAIAGSV